MRYNACSPSETGKPMALLAVVPFNAMGLCFCLHQLFLRNTFGVSIPTIGKIHPNIVFGKSSQQSPKCFAASVAQLPIYKFSCCTTVSLPNPYLVFFECTKCHISSSSTTISPFGIGFLQLLCVYLRTHLMMVDGCTNKTFAIAVKDNPKQYNKTAVFSSCMLCRPFSLINWCLQLLHK